MRQIFHGRARTPEAVRRAIQYSQESLRVPANRHGINQKTVARRKWRTAVKDKHTLLPLDGCLYTLQATIPHLTRAPLHRCLQRHGISRLPEVTADG